MAASLASRLGGRLRRTWQGPLAEPPRPLLDPDHGVMVVWAAKAACTASFVWFSGLVGMQDDLRRSRMSPHRYRQTRYYGSELYRRGRAKPLAGYLVLHILRDPYTRTVSSYRQALKTGYLDKRLATLPAGPLDSRTGFSFLQFLDYLETIDLEQANIHHRLQWHAVEDKKGPDRVINISRQDLFAELNRLEGELALAPTDFTALGWLHARESRRKARTELFVGAEVAERRFDHEAGIGRRPWPDYEQFLSAPVRRRIERLYAKDFEAFEAYL
jgi:Sulfotransferase family